MKKKLGTIIACLLLAVVTATTFLMTGCTTKKEREYIIDANNETGISYWSNIAFVTAEAREKGYTGSDACQHLNSITRSAQNKNLMFFGTDAAGAYKSVDGGYTWKPCNNGLLTHGVCRIEIDPRNDNHVVAVNVAGGEGSSGFTGICYSFDCGEHWIKGTVDTGNDKKRDQIGFVAHQYFYDILEFDPTSYDEELGYCTDVYFATPCERDTYSSKIQKDEAFIPNRGVYKSEDGGKRFVKIDGTDELTDGIITVVDGNVSVANMNGIFTIGEDGSCERKSDMNVHSFFYTAGKYYIQCADGIYTTEDLNASYSKIESESFPSADRNPRNLAVSARNPDRMMMFARKAAKNTYSNRPYYSHDGGKTWTIGELLDSDELFFYYTYHAGTYTFDPDDEDVIIGIIGGEVIRSVDGGKSFLYSGEGVSDITCGGQFHFNIYNENLVYAGAYDFGGALTTDGGRTWKNLSLSKDSDGKDIMGGYAADENTIFGVYTDTWTPGDYFKDYRYVCFTHDGGKTVNIDPKQIIKPSERNTGKEDVYKDLKIDTAIATAFESSYQSPNDKKILFCANYRSTDNGYTWVNMQNATKGEKCLQVYTHCGKTLYGCSKNSGFVLQSDDNGKTWSKVNTEELTMIKTSTAKHITDIAVDGRNGYIYAAYGDKLWRMRLDGTEPTDLTKNMKKNNMGTQRIFSVALDPNCPQIVYVCGSGDYYFDTDSVRRSCDFGESWQTLTPSSSSASIVSDGSSLGHEGRCVRVRSNGEVWVSAMCLGFCKITPPYEL